MKRIMFLVIFMFSLTSVADVSDHVELSSSYLIPDKADMTAKEVLSHDFVPVLNQFSISVLEPVVWVKLKITNSSVTQQSIFLHNNLVFFSKQINLFTVSNDVVMDESLFQMHGSGSSSQITGSTLIKTLEINPEETVTFLIRNQANYAQVFDFEIHDQASSYQALINKNALANVLVAILLALAFYNLMLYFFGERKELLFYSLYLINASIGLFYMYGSVYQHLNIYSNTVEWMSVTAILVPFFLSLFVKFTFDTAEFSGRVDMLLNSVILFSIFNLGVALFIDRDVAMQLVSVTFVFSFCALMYLAYCYYKSEHPLIKIFLVAYTIYIIGMSGTLFSLYGYLPFNQFTYYSSGFCLVVEALMFAYLLRYRIILLENEIVEREQAEMQLNYMANHDPLTGLPNRRMFMDIASAVISMSKRDNKCFAVLFMDIDGFKKVNDTLGHDAGDELLVKISDIIRSRLRVSDLVARIGGDEFVILLPDVRDENTISLILEPLINRLRQPYIINDENVSISTSVGVSFFPQHGDDIEALVSQADKMMYQVKRSGKNNWAIFCD